MRAVYRYSIRRGQRVKRHLYSSADFAKLIADETEKWGKVIRAANIKAE